MDPDTVCPGRLVSDVVNIRPDPKLPERLDPDAVNIRPDPKLCPYSLPEVFM